MLTEFKQKDTLYLYCWCWRVLDCVDDQMKPHIIPAFWEKVWYEINRAVFIGSVGNPDQIEDLTFPVMRQLREIYKC